MKIQIKQNCFVSIEMHTFSFSGEGTDGFF